MNAGRLVSVVVLLTACRAVSADSVLDFIRNYDLNDYSLGVSLSVSQKPYVGIDQSAILYPYLTSFQHSAFTDDWFLIRGGDVGVRYVTQSDWEFGLIGRIETLGFGGTESEQLRGLDARQTTIEAGPMIGWRGWPVHLQLRSYWDLLGRHNSGVTDLEFSLPRRFGRGYAIPGVRLSYQHQRYTNYYYGIADYESTPDRPAYSPDAALNAWVGLTLGYEITPKWLLSTTVGVEYLDSTISASPIVDEDTLWSVNVGLAYNADIFSSAEHDGDNTPLFEMRLSGLYSSADSTVTRDSSQGEPGEEIDLEEVLGVSDEETVFLLDTFYRLGYYHRIDVNYFELKRSSSHTLTEDIEFGDIEIGAGSDIGVESWSRAFRIAYSYSLMRDNQKELGVSGGLSRTRFDTDLAVEDENKVERVRVKALVPTIGIFGSLTLGENWLLSADINAFAMDFDRLEGFLAYANLNLERSFGENVRAGLGYSYFGTRLESTKADVRGVFRFTHYGPKLNVVMTF